MSEQNNFKPFVSPQTNMKELTLKSILVGGIFGVIFGASTVYLALKAGLTVSASIPIAVISILLGKLFLKTTILENNIIQTTGSAGESIAAGVVFTLPGFLFLSNPDSAQFFNYITILTLSIFGGILGTLMMIPLRRSLIVKEHETLPYPEGTACASVLKAGEKGGDLAKTALYGVGFAFIYAMLQKIFHVIAETPSFMTRQTQKFSLGKTELRNNPRISWRRLYNWAKNSRRISCRRRIKLVCFYSITCIPCTWRYYCSPIGKTGLPGRCYKSRRTWRMGSGNTNFC